ncbi:MAG: hypothetical protein ACXVCN_19735 [Bdellovibrio sp.]
MKLLLIVLQILFCRLSLADSSVLENKIPELLKSNPTIIIVGDDHNNPGLAFGINKLLKAVHANF